jgi:hypothetical protein
VPCHRDRVLVDLDQATPCLVAGHRGHPAGSAEVTWLLRVADGAHGLHEVVGDVERDGHDGLPIGAEEEERLSRNTPRAGLKKAGRGREAPHTST